LSGTARVRKGDLYISRKSRRATRKRYRKVARTLAAQNWDEEQVGRFPRERGSGVIARRSPHDRCDVVQAICRDHHGDKRHRTSGETVSAVYAATAIGNHTAAVHDHTVAAVGRCAVRTCRTAVRIQCAAVRTRCATDSRWWARARTHESRRQRNEGESARGYHGLRRYRYMNRASERDPGVLGPLDEIATRLSRSPARVPLRVLDRVYQALRARTLSHWYGRVPHSRRCAALARRADPTCVAKAFMRLRATGFRVPSR
jgi:hypothetical protein